jgi:hypothetical protein
VSGQIQAPAALPPGERALGTHWIGDWLEPRAGLDDVEKRKFLFLLGLKLQPLGRPASSQSPVALLITLSRLLLYIVNDFKITLFY